MIAFLQTRCKRFADRVVAPLLAYVANRVPRTNVLHELERRTAAECADYAQARMAAALHFVDKRDLWNHALGKISLPGLAVEFGVWNGKSINHLAKRLRPGLVYGFDSFEGLQEDWAGWTETKGTFDRHGELPPVEPNVRLIKGWFDASLPPFLAANPGPFAFVHLDCDTYEAARAVFAQVPERIVAGTVIVFDEYFGFRGWKIGEYRAWQEFVDLHGIAYDYLSFSHQQVAVRVRGR